MTTAAQKKHLAGIRKLIEDATVVLNDSVGNEQSVARARQFNSEVRHVLRVFHEELLEEAQRSANAQIVQLFTEDEAEGERHVGRFFVTNVWDREDPTDSIDRRCGIDRQAIREAVQWLEVLTDKLDLHGGGKPGMPKQHSHAVARIRDTVRALLAAKMPFKEVCARLDKDRVPRPPGATWRDLTWSLAYLKYNKSVKSWLSKAKSPQH
jgi:uncharacterized protein Smg (DUF494 family)